MPFKMWLFYKTNARFLCCYAMRHHVESLYYTDHSQFQRSLVECCHSQSTKVSTADPSIAGLQNQATEGWMAVHGKA
jgi:hypothetical protein